MCVCVWYYYYYYYFNPRKNEGGKKLKRNIIIVIIIIVIVSVLIKVTLSCVNSTVNYIKNPKRRQVVIGLVTKGRSE